MEITTTTDLRDQVASVVSAHDSVRIDEADASGDDAGRVTRHFTVHGGDVTGDGIETHLTVTLADGRDLRVPVTLLAANGERVQPSVVLFHPVVLDDPVAIERQIALRHPPLSSPIRVVSPSPAIRVTVHPLSKTTSRILLSLSPIDLHQHHGGNGVEGDVRVYLDDLEPPYATAHVAVVP